MEVSSKLFLELKDPELPRLVAVAERLHSNFYEGFMSREEVEPHAQDVERLVEKLRGAGVEGV